MSKVLTGLRWRPQLPAATALAAFAAVLLLVNPAAPADLGRLADERASVVEVILADNAELDALVATGVDLDHHITHTGDGIVVHAVVTGNEVTTLTRAGFTFGKVLHTPQDAAQRVAEREATIAAHLAENREYAAAADFSARSTVSDVRIIRADYYTSGDTQVLSVEAKWAQGQADASPLTVERDSGPGTEIGSGGTQTISRFVDAGVYLYHRGAAQVSSRPAYVRITSPSGDVAVAKVNEWLPIPPKDPEGPGYMKDFVASYLTPTELYDRIKALSAQYPKISEIVELPYRTNGYRRKAQAVLGTVDASRVAVDSLAWGHQGGNDISVELADPGTADAPLAVTVTGTAVRVDLATDGSGTVTSTAEQVVAALNAQAGTLLTAYTYRGSPGTGVVAPVATASPRRHRSPATRTRCTPSASASTATAPGSECWRTPRSTPGSGCRRWSPSRPPSGCCATTRTTARPATWWTTSTSGSLRRSTRTAGTTPSTTSTPSART